jgi:hypothetical protein
MAHVKHYTAKCGEKPGFLEKLGFFCINMSRNYL